MTRNPKDTYLPTFYRLSQPEDRSSFQQLLEHTPGLFVFDEILGQVEELVKSKNPRKVYKKEELTAAAKAHLGPEPWDEFGVWLYYPWSGRVVHLLDEEDFIEVRTNRNNYKISPAERAILANKKIGVIGLSIGQSIAMTMTMERIYGEIRLADFDILELSNYNRIRTGLHNLGISKVITVAREIMEIDPYLNVKCFTEGLVEDNMDQFFTEDGKIDLLVEACDGLDIKILSRRKARELKIPVVMDTSDRGMLDVERFDLEPNRSILHGLIDHLDASKLKGLTNEEKVPFLLPMIGANTMSDRLKASMLEIEQSITTWPQLASSVALGGAIATDVCRRIFLDQFHDSGRYYMDTEMLIKDKADKGVQEQPLNIRPSITYDDMRARAKAASYRRYPEQYDLPSEILEQLITAAGQAPSGANIQPWRWLYQEGILYLFFDDVYAAGLLDCGNTISFASLGAAVENLVLKAQSLQLEVNIEKPVLQKDTQLVSVFRFFKQGVVSPVPVEATADPALVEAIPHRLTNRNIRKRQPIEKSKLLAVQEAARSIPGADLLLIDDEKLMEAIGEVTAKMDRIRVMHEGGHKDFRAEIRWTKEEVMQARNGVDLLGTVDLTATELAGWQMAKHWSVIKLLNDWNTGSGLEKIQRKSVAGSTALGLLTMPAFNCDEFFQGGRAMERLWLKATLEGISVHPASLSTLIFNTYLYNEEDVFPPRMREEVKVLREEFVRLLNLDGHQGEVLLFRFFVSDPPKDRAIRYPIEKILYVAP